MMHGQKNIKIY